jgi:ubiquinone/menaquinone biosynthesis C-methylase UbiE/predicted GNAT family N-acyltransferase
MADQQGHRWFAAGYDRLNARWERTHGAKLRRGLLAGLRGDVVEIGAGTGANFEHYPGDARVVALEPDPYMFARAQTRLRPNIELRQAPAERLPIPDASADGVVSTIVLCTVDDVPKALGEIRRVLRPGGEFRFLEHVRATGLAGAVMDVVQPVYGWFSGGCHLNRRTEQAIGDAGFEMAQLERMKIQGVPAITGVALPEPTVSGVRIVSTAQQREDALSVRIAVFVDEQGIAREDEIDEYDDVAVHCVGYAGGAPVAAGRLVVMDGYGKIGRMAVLKEHRGSGLGARVLGALEREGASRGLRLFKLSAQLSARGFYDRTGYTAVGDVYDEVGIPHIAMEKRIQA